MMGLTKSLEFGVFLISFVLIVDGIRGDERNRKDAETDPFEKVTLADDGALRSTLFGSCLAISMTLEVKFYSIEIPDTTNEFIRYVPDTWQLAVPSEWKTVTSVPPVAMFADCADAAHRGGNAMFKYSGGNDCKVSNQSYDLTYTPACEAEIHDAVFISSLAALACKLPFIQAGPSSGIVDAYDCIEINQKQMSMSTVEAESYCRSIQALEYKPTSGTSYDDLIRIFHSLGVNSGIFFVGGSILLSGFYSWNSAPINQSVLVGLPPPSGNYVMFINATNNFKIDYCETNDCKGGVVCLSEENLPYR